MDLPVLVSLHEAGEPALLVISTFNEGAGPSESLLGADTLNVRPPASRGKPLGSVVPVNIELSPALMRCIPRASLAASGFADSSV